MNFRYRLALLMVGLLFIPLVYAQTATPTPGPFPTFTPLPPNVPTATPGVRPAFGGGGDDSGVRDAIWNADESRLLTWTNNFDLDRSYFTFWDMAQLDNPISIQHPRAIRDLAWSTNEQWLVTWSTTGDFGGMLFLWNLSQLDSPRSWRTSREIRKAAWDANGTILVIRTDDGFYTWKVDEQREPVLVPLRQSVWGFEWNGNQLLYWTNERVHVARFVGTRLEVTASTPITGMRGGRWTPSGNDLLLWGDSGAWRWNPAGGLTQVDNTC